MRKEPRSRNAKITGLVIGTFFFVLFSIAAVAVLMLLVGVRIFPVDPVTNKVSIPFAYLLLIFAAMVVCAVMAIRRCIRRIRKLTTGASPVPVSSGSPEPDDLLLTAVEVVLDSEQASVSMLQRRLKLDYTSAAQLVDQLEGLGIIGPFNDAAPREILISREQWVCMKASFASALVAAAPAPVDPLQAKMTEVDHMEGHAFEYFCADLLSKNGFTDVSVTPGSGDQGVDVLATQLGVRYAIQCKCYSSDLGNTPVQEVNTGKVIYHCHVGAVLTNRYFTQGAKDAAEATNVMLWDRDYLEKLISTAEGL